ncbi:keratin-associated protein 6-5-like [Acomys russatus]|uniref:keratin-associated protein 6-5-like n=1 Tax=Acomys russatus TaxID=60746 RepID=UPI0021E2C55E|nr:keratin-associated protein 6-5-like [Acomys russatus]
MDLQESKGECMESFGESKGRTVQTQVTYTPLYPRTTSTTNTMCGYYRNYYGGRGYGCCGYGGYGYGGLGCGYGSYYGCGYRGLGCGYGCGYGYGSRSLCGCGYGCGSGYGSGFGCYY